MSDSKVERIESVVVRFSGDSGDGMQVTGSQFSNTVALGGNDFSTFPDFPAEIRAPHGTIAGVSGFQVHLSSQEVNTSGDEPDVLVAMNPAALKANLADLRKGGTIILNIDQFDEKNLEKAGFKKSPLESGELTDYKIVSAHISSQTMEALKSLDIDPNFKLRCKNFYALGLVYFMFGRPLDNTRKWIEKKFAQKPDICKANLLALRAGYNFGETTESTLATYMVPPAKLAPGIYRQLSGNTATAWGLVQASKASGRNLFLGSYPITPATEILHELSQLKNFGVKTFQAEDEIAAICSAIGASYGGALGLTTTSGPGLALKSEAINLAVMLELPLVIVDVQRGGPSTGLPTKTEQADLMQAIYGRNGDSPVIVVAASRPADCFHMAFEAARLALEHMSPVIFLSDAYVANGAEPFKIPDFKKDYPKINTHIVDGTKPEGEKFKPFKRDAETFVRSWAIPGMKGYEHRVGSLEKNADGSGMVSYRPEDHAQMSEYRIQKIARVENNIPLQKIKGDSEGDLLVVSWGGSFGAAHVAVERHQKIGHHVSHMHLSYLNPMPKNVGEILKKFKKILVPELNHGQLKDLLNARFCCGAIGHNKIQGTPFTVREIETAIERELH